MAIPSPRIPFSVNFALRSACPGLLSLGVQPPSRTTPQLTDVTGTRGATTEGEFEAPAFRCEIFSADPALSHPLIGYAVTASGLALANPTAEPVTFQLELAGRRQSVTLEAFSSIQRQVSEFFPFYVPRDCGNFEFLRIESPQRRPFAALPLTFSFFVNPGGGRESRPGLDLHVGASTGARFPFEPGLGLPVEVLASLTRNGTEIVLTRFGFTVRSPADEPRTYLLALGAQLSQHIFLTGFDEALLSVVTAGPQIPLIFDSGKVVFVNGPSCCEVPEVEVLENGLARVTVGDPCGLTRIDVDPVAEEVVAVQVGQRPGQFCL